MKEQLETDSSVLVMGVGRSGTTAVYALLQEILEDVFPGDVDYVYEPFLWDRKVFNKPYKDLTDEFRYSASVSIDGMYHHKRLPMLVGESSTIDPQSRAWLKETLTAQHGKRHYLGKMIRVSGRVRLIRELTPNTKIIFLIRNPLDVLNSASQLFSFYGSEFYESDFPRFASEVEERYGRRAQLRDPEAGQIAAEYCYWYFSNCAFLEYAKENPSNILTLSYEAFVEDRNYTVSRICEFIGVQFRSEYTGASRKQYGIVQQGVCSLNKAEFAFLSDRVFDYETLLGSVQYSPNAQIRELVRAANFDPPEKIHRHSINYNSLYSGNELVKIKSECARLRLELTQIKDSKRYRLVNSLLAHFDRVRNFKKS